MSSKDLLLQQLFGEEILRLSYIKRFNGRLMVQQETVMEHTAWVAYYAMTITDGLGLDFESCYIINKAALLHDLDEIETYDINWLVKYNSFNGDDIRKLIDMYIENKSKGHVLERHFEFLKDANQNNLAKAVVKLADWMDSIRICRREIMLENQQFREVLTIAIGKSIEQITKIDSLIPESGKNKFLQTLKQTITICHQ